MTAAIGRGDDAAYFPYPTGPASDVGKGPCRIWMSR
jgi:hypothetical protein